MRRRNKVISVHFTEEELEHLNRKVELSGLLREQFIRKLVAGFRIKPKPTEGYRQISREISAVGNNINQIAHVVNATGKCSEAQLKQVLHCQAEIRESLEKLR